VEVPGFGGPARVVESAVAATGHASSPPSQRAPVARPQRVHCLPDPTPMPRQSRHPRLRYADCAATVWINEFATSASWRDAPAVILGTAGTVPSASALPVWWRLGAGSTC